MGILHPRPASSHSTLLVVTGYAPSIGRIGRDWYQKSFATYSLSLTPTSRKSGHHAKESLRVA